MVNIRLGLLHKIQNQYNKCYYLINHAKNVETKIKSEGEGIQVLMMMTVAVVINVYMMQQVLMMMIVAVVIVINVYMMQVVMNRLLVTCKHMC